MNAELFRWARETSGLSSEQAARALGIKDVERLHAIELGEEEPSRALLLKMAKQYRRPLVTFYLPTPPRRGDRGEDFRTLPENRSIAADALLDALIRDVKARQAVVRSLAEDEEAAPLAFVDSCSIRDGVQIVLTSIKSTLAISLAEYRRQKTAEEAFAYLRNKAESAGIYVLLIGNLGSHHSTIAVETFRGFAIADKFAPFVIINDQDARTAWSFTLLHEIAHLWLGTTGVSGNSSEQAIEKFCNEVASSFLLPHEELATLQIKSDAPSEELIQIISGFASTRHLSRKMVAYALFRSGRLSEAVWGRLNQLLDDLWIREKAARKEKNKLKEIKATYYIVRRYHLGHALLNLVGRSIEAGTLTPVKAAKVLGVKPRSVYPLLTPLGRVDITGTGG
ncbi:MAG TPA: XRE family transcriptional regulator [Nitrospira sp.]|nr:XRE family transcriptional regulator [Nitrospira sp.]